MTPKQKTRCDKLAKRIAELAPDGAWAVPGAAIRNPKTGFVWRRMSCYWEPDDEDSWGSDILSEHGQRAVACGPLWRDLATLNILLGDEGEVARDSGEWWANVNGCTCDGETRPEAILAAKVAELEAK